jgi:hypothetical protein
MIDSIRQLENELPAGSIVPPPTTVLSANDAHIYRPPSPRSGGNRHIAWVALAVPCLASDFLMMPMFSAFTGPPAASGVILPFAALGCILAQGCLLAAWLAWGAQRFLRRLAVHWGIAAGLYLTWLAGFAVSVLRESSASEFGEISTTVLLGVPLVSIAAQLPLWVVRYFFGWRLARPDSSGAVAPEPALTISDLMLATLLVAAALALARFVPPTERESERWAVWSVVFAVASGTCTISLLPAGAILMRPGRFGHRLLFGGLYSGLIVGILWLFVAVARWYGGRLPPREVFIGLTCLMLGFAGTLMLAANAARAQGYRLIWRRRGGRPGDRV